MPDPPENLFEEAAGRGSRDAGDEITERELNGRKRLSSSWKFIQPPCHRHGYQILCRNFRCRQGEIDIIARDRDYLVFIEVKYRRDEHEGDPAEAVDARKQARIFRTARYYMTRYHISEDTPCRFDVVAVLGSNVRLIRDAFWCG